MNTIAYITPNNNPNKQNCAYCKYEFELTGKKEKYCSRKCAQHSANKKYRNTHPERIKFFVKRYRKLYHDQILEKRREYYKKNFSDYRKLSQTNMND